MSKHRPKTPAAGDGQAPPDPVLTGLKVAIQAAETEIERRRLYDRLLTIEERLLMFQPIPGDPPYRRPDGFVFSDDFDKS